MTEFKKSDEKDILTNTRKKLGLTQQQVADKAHIAVRHYQMFENGQRKLSSSSFWLAIRVLQALDLDITAFARGEYSIEKSAD